MSEQDPSTAARFVRAVNDRDPIAFSALFHESSVVNDAGRHFRGAEIRTWGEREIFAAQVTFDVLNVTERDGETVVTTKVDGTFDRTGLPDPLVIEQHIRERAGQIDELTCRLVQPSPA